jgi:hypothetical protein
LYGGSFPEERVLSQPRYQQWVKELVYLPMLPQTDLSAYDVLLVPEGMHHRKMQAAEPQLRAFLDGGGTVAAFGDQPLSWLPGLSWEFSEARRPAPGEIQVQHPDHPFHKSVSPEDIWHHHGFFHPPAEAETLFATPDGGAVLYLDRASTGGTILATSLDLLVHLGTVNNPVSARFLNQFLPWLAAD